MKLTYSKPTLEVKDFAQFENVYTYCNKGNAHAQGCVDITGSGNASDKVGNPSGSAAFSGGGRSGL
jgi:hypothetical protein